MSDNTDLIGSKGGAWDINTHNTLHPKNFNVGLARFISTKINPKSFLEFGSGLGWLAKYINENCQLNRQYCIEPNIIQGVYDNLYGPHILPVDIFQDIHPFVINYKFDLVMSIEVAEHIDRNYHDQLFDFLVSRTDNWVVFSGARIGQGGHGHIAERDEDEWKLEFLQRGLDFEIEMTEAIRQACDKKNINHRKNLMVFKRADCYKVLDEIEARAKPYLIDLWKIIQANPDCLDNNPFYMNRRDAMNGMPSDSLKEKRLNYINRVQNSNNILEFNFNFGYYVLLALLANKHAKITIIDHFGNEYTRACFKYLDILFSGRISLIKENSLHAINISAGEKFTLVHCDGKTIQQTPELLRSLAKVVKHEHLLIIRNALGMEVNTSLSALEKSVLNNEKTYY